MAFTSGTALSASDLIGAIKSIAETNGWVVNTFEDVTAGATKWLSLTHGDCTANLFSEINGTHPNDTFPERIEGAELKVKGATGYDSGLAWDQQPGTHSSFAKIGAAYSEAMQGVSFGNADDGVEYPASYFCFAHQNPAVVMIVVETLPGKYQWLLIGELSKYGTWTGGGFVAASGCSADDESVDPFAIGGINPTRSYMPFGRMQGSFSGPNGFQASSTFLHAELAEYAPEIWLLSDDERVPNGVAASNTYVAPLPARSPNQFNAVSAMVPFFVWTQAQGGDMPLGVVEHIRYCPLDYFDPGDIFSIGPERWMVFPFYKRGGYTGLYGFAVRYDGP